MATIIALLFALLKIIFRLFILWLYGWLAGEILNKKGSCLRNIIIGFIGKYVSVFVYICVFKVVEWLNISVLEEFMIFSSMVLSLILPVFGSVFVLYMYKSHIQT